MPLAHVPSGIFDIAEVKTELCVENRFRLTALCAYPAQDPFGSFRGKTLKMTTSLWMEGYKTASYGDILHRLCYAFVGLHTGFKQNVHLRYLTLYLWLLIHVAGGTSFAVDAYDTITMTVTKSLTTFTLLLSNVVFVGSAMHFTSRLFSNHDEIESFLRSAGRPCSQLFVQLIYIAPFEFMSLRRVLHAGDAFTLMRNIYVALLLPFMGVFFLASNDIIFKLQNSHNTLLFLSNNVEAHQGKIRYLKWKLRDRIQAINRNFAWSWAMSFLLTVSTAVYVIIDLINRSSTLFDRTVVGAGEFFYLIRLFGLAKGASMLKESCLNTEKKLWGRKQMSRTRRRTLKELLPVMTFRADWDSLRSGCFPLEAKTFFSFLTTSVTCTAIVLQFDHSVLRMIAEVNSEP